VTIPSPDSLRVLIALDDEGARATVRRHLAAAGIDAVVEDLRGEPGAVAIGRLRAAGVTAPILAIAPDEPRAEALIVAGATDALPREDVTPARLAAHARAAERLARAERAALDARALAERAARRRAEILAIVSHDLRGPLNAIGIALEVLKDEAIVGEKRARYVAATRRSIERADRMVTDLMTAAQIEAGTLRLDPISVAARSLLEQARKDHELVAGKCGTTITVGEVEDVTVRADRERLLQALGNLIQNAIRHATGTPEITLAARRASGAVELSVRDHGPGIAPEALPHLFDRYTQGGDRRGSAGLGLAIVRGIARAHGGDARGGPASGGGAEFTIVLPAAE
jgi:two-component system sensor histidine kinase BaeS